MTMDVRDRIIQEHAPVVMAPNFGELEPLEAAGHRYLAGRNGIFLEVKRPWLHLKWPMHDQGAIAPALPFGEVAQGVKVAFKLPRELLARFVAEARKLSPFEHAAWLVWDAQAQELLYQDLDVQEFSEGGVRYKRPHLPAHQSLAVDLHSHGKLAAFFSATDDADDEGEVKIAAVVGNLDVGTKATWAIRLCALGIYVPLPGPKEDL